MILKTFFQDKDYKIVLRRRLYFYSAIMLFGLILVLVDIFALQDSTLPSFVQGFYLGAGTGMSIAGAGFTVYTVYLMRKPSAAKKAEISERDEREKEIMKAAMVNCFEVIYFLILVSIFIVLPFSLEAFFVLFVITVVITFTFFISLAWHKRHM